MKELTTVLLDVRQKQLEIWLKKAEEEGKVIKSSKKPIQYQRAGIGNSLKKESEPLLQDHKGPVSTAQQSKKKTLESYITKETASKPKNHKKQNEDKQISFLDNSKNIKKPLTITR